MTHQVVGLLGRGGTAVVELAIDDAGRRVARKRVALHGSAAEIAVARRRIRRESEVLRSLEHPGIVSLLAVEDDGEDVVLVMPYLPGGTLTERVEAGGPLPPAEVERLGQVLLGALAAAHRQGVVHRDITPDNVLFDEDGRPVLADFGVALFRSATRGLTASGLVVGTPGFMAPEQARGEPVTAASDVFALGATLLYAITGRAPYGEADARTLMWRASEGRVVRVPVSVPAPLRQRLEAMLARDPARRPTAAEVLGGPTGTRAGTQLSPPVTTSPWRTWRAVGVALALATVTGIVLLWSGRGPEDTSTAGAGPASDPSPCVPLPYRPCGSPPAPFTDGRECLYGHADYDGIRLNGCEAAPDRVDGSTLHRVISANLVPVDDVDTYRLPVVDRFQLVCNGRLRVTLIAAEGVAQRVEVLRRGRTVADATSTDGLPATATVRDPSCGGDDSGMLAVRVITVRGHSARPYRLYRSGSF